MEMFSGLSEKVSFGMKIFKYPLTLPCDLFVVWSEVEKGSLHYCTEVYIAAYDFIAARSGIGRSYGSRAYRFFKPALSFGWVGQVGDGGKERASVSRIIDKRYMD